MSCDEKLKFAEENQEWKWKKMLINKTELTLISEYQHHATVEKYLWTKWIKHDSLWSSKHLATAKIHLNYGMNRWLHDTLITQPTHSVTSNYCIVAWHHVLTTQLSAIWNHWMLTKFTVPTREPSWGRTTWSEVIDHVSPWWPSRGRTILTSHCFSRRTSWGRTTWSEVIGHVSPWWPSRGSTMLTKVTVPTRELSWRRTMLHYLKSLIPFHPDDPCSHGRTMLTKVTVSVREPAEAEPCYLKSLIVCHPIDPVVAEQCSPKPLSQSENQLRQNHTIWSHPDDPVEAEQSAISRADIAVRMQFNLHWSTSSNIHSYCNKNTHHSWGLVLLDGKQVKIHT
jgi:hypothetical protein